MNITALFIVSGAIFITSSYTLAQTRPHNNNVLQITIPTPEVSTSSPLTIQSIKEDDGGPQYKNKHNKSKEKKENKYGNSSDENYMG